MFSQRCPNFRQLLDPIIINHSKGTSRSEQRQRASAFDSEQKETERRPSSPQHKEKEAEMIIIRTDQPEYASRFKVSGMLGDSDFNNALIEAIKASDGSATLLEFLLSGLFQEVWMHTELMDCLNYILTQRSGSGKNCLIFLKSPVVQIWWKWLNLMS